MEFRGTQARVWTCEGERMHGWRRVGGSAFVALEIDIASCNTTQMQVVGIPRSRLHRPPSRLFGLFSHPSLPHHEPQRRLRRRLLQKLPVSYSTVLLTNCTYYQLHKLPERNRAKRDEGSSDDFNHPPHRLSFPSGHEPGKIPSSNHKAPGSVHVCSGAHNFIRVLP